MSEWEEFDFGENKKVDDSNGIRQFVSKLFSNWYWFVICGALGLLIAFVYLRYSTPIYQINAKILVNDEQKGTGLENSMLGDLSGMLGTKSTVDNEVEVLKTRDLMEQVVRSLEAQITYYRTGTIRDVELFQSPYRFELFEEDRIQNEKNILIRPEKSGGLELEYGDRKISLSYGEMVNLEGIGEIKITRNESVPIEFGEYLVRVSNVDSKVAEFREKLSVEVSNKMVTVIDLGFPYAQKEKGEKILATLIDQYVQGNLNDKNTIADSTITFIEERLMLVGQELGTVEGQIQSFKQESQLADISAQSQILLENSSQYIKELAEVETQLNIIRSMERYLKDKNNLRILPSAMLPNDLVFSSLVERYNTLLLERDRKSLSSTEDNPAIINLDLQISNVRKDMLTNLQSTKSRLSISREDLLRKTEQMDARIRTVPATERTYLDLARQQQIKQELYVFLLQKREETAISKTSNISNSRIIDSPRASTEAISPRRNITLGIGLLVGLFLPFIIIYIRDVLNTKIESKDDIMKRTDLSIIGEICHKDTYEEEIVSTQSRSAIAENFRSLRTNLAFYLNKSEQKVALLTSGMSGEGKSFIALNLATVIAFSGKNVVVMEMDLRRPKLSEKLDSKNEFGFSNYIIDGSIRAEDIVAQTTINENLYVIGSGPIPPNPSELILSARTDELMAYLRAQFDYIIIDAPPIGLVTDAQLLSKYADLSLYVVRQGYTEKAQIKLINELHEHGKFGKMTVLINDIKFKKGYGYGYGYGRDYYG